MKITNVLGWPRPCRPRWQTIAPTIFVTTGFLLVGCGGPSQEDLIMRAARRDRPTSGGSKPDTSANPQPADPPAASSSQTPAGAAPQSPASTAKASSPDAAADPAVSPADPETVPSLPAIEQRKPDEPWSAERRYQRARENLTAIAEALGKFYEENEQFPKAYTRTPGGMKGLSWRVELLPYLGYPDLYERFDFSKPWNVEPNKSLLLYIPPEYVSPERFDTKTNYLLPAHRNFVFAGNQPRAKFQIEDGAENTILLVEAADSQAAPWTQPKDFSPPDDTDFRDELFGPRADGAFAVWASGLPVLLAKDLSAKQLRDAFTYEAGDGQLAGAVHRDIPPERQAASGEDDAPVTAASTTDDRAEDDADVTPPGDSGQTAAAAALARRPIPAAGELASAQERLREIFADQLSGAKNRDAQLALAREMVQQARAMPEDPAGAYALQTAAMRLASGAGGLDVLLQAVEVRIEQFDVDPMAIESAALLEFGKHAVRARHRAGSRVPRDAVTYAERAVAAVHQAALSDDYDQAIRLAGYAARVTEDAPVDGLSQSFARLRTLLETSRSRYAEVGRHLAAFRRDASDAEAAATVGRFLCFVKGDWPQGLSLLSQHASAKLRRVAERDLGGPGDPPAQVATGDAWWQLAEQASHPVDEQGARDRAVHWYRRALDRLPDSLDKIHAQARVREAGESDPATPLASVRRIAKTLGIELRTAGAAFANR